MIHQDAVRVLFHPVAPTGLIAVVSYGRVGGQAREGRRGRAGRALGCHPALCRPEELKILGDMSPMRAEEYLAGRMASHLVLRRLGRDSGPVLRKRDGSPLFPGNLVGSISHSHGLAAAFVTMDSHRLVGIDIQWCDAARLLSVARSVTAPEERLGGLFWNAPAGMAPEIADLAVRFSIKEAVRKLLSLPGAHAETAALEFSDILVETRDRRAVCRPLRPWARWPRLSVSWAWILCGGEGPFMVSQKRDDPVSAGMPAWVLAWVEGQNDIG